MLKYHLYGQPEVISEFHTYKLSILKKHATMCSTSVSVAKTIFMQEKNLVRVLAIIESVLPKRFQIY